ncbi:holo-ACP synthase [Halobacillus yeomjeoni]|uniref:Holo-[acyl-carrier-protein] synthase n=1 Tax=Halobacillus yeomjeoni TaxID=311194 RepID=A0A931MWF8_9BACI|nr:holo-ACP synthase [Halobacillus yeomjeoni]MBH0231567.1 holo-ACP synthase [Halobacillus yeomjeoni]MCA0985111.1 holo-ACP synthase [Halobacillus yeomjeoni]
MIKGIGIDIIDMQRIKQSIKRNPRFVQRILTEKEQERYFQLSERRQVEYLAGRFAAKEAFAKSIGTGIGELGFQDIEILSESSGAPTLKARGYEDFSIWVSISHSSDHAVAQVVLEE